jgi:hypothetical protein
MSFVDAPDWSTIPAPQDDGATQHLVGAKLASVFLRATDGSMVDLSVLRGRTVPAHGQAWGRETRRAGT